MSRGPIRLLGLSGSLRRASSNTMLLRAAAQAAPEGVELRLFESLGDVPIFNPDLDQPPWPAAVVDLRRGVDEADGLVIACPEYAHGIPGGLKNALDWLVSGSEAPAKPVALFHASARSTHGREALTEVLRTMSMSLRPEFALTIPLLGFDEARCGEILASADSRARLCATLDAYAASLRGDCRAPEASLGTANRRSHISGAGQPPGVGPSAELQGSG